METSRGSQSFDSVVERTGHAGMLAKTRVILRQPRAWQGNGISVVPFQLQRVGEALGRKHAHGRLENNAMLVDIVPRNFQRVSVGFGGQGLAKP
jgi:hypothetical protein